MFFKIFKQIVHNRHLHITNENKMIKQLFSDFSQQWFLAPQIFFKMTSKLVGSRILNFTLLLLLCVKQEIDKCLYYRVWKGLNSSLPYAKCYTLVESFCSKSYATKLENKLLTPQRKKRHLNYLTNIKHKNETRIKTFKTMKFAGKISQVS